MTIAILGPRDRRGQIQGQQRSQGRYRTRPLTNKTHRADGALGVARQPRGDAVVGAEDGERVPNSRIALRRSQFAPTAWWPCRSLPDRRTRDLVVSGDS